MDSKIQVKSNLDILADFAADYPVDVAEAANAIGVRVLYDTLPSGISGKIQRDERGGYYIVANTTEPEVRQRFTIAHELGHYIYHRALIGDGIADSPAYRAPDEAIYDETPLERFHETQANQFAANLLMPRKLIRKAEAEHPGADVQQLAKLFKVSEDAMRIRKGMPTKKQAAMQDLGLVEVN
ncbi:ImmA/IrrE family metallo-endopeptidase [Martelella sp. FLE1502]